MPAEVSPLVHLIWTPFLVFMVGLAFGWLRTGGIKSGEG